MTTTSVYHTPKQTNDILLCPSPPRNQLRYCDINASCPTMPACLDDGMTTFDSVLGVDLGGVAISRDVRCTDTNTRRKSFAIPTIRLKPRPSKYTPPSRLDSSIKKKAVLLTRSSSYQNVKSLKMTRSCSYQHLLAKSFQRQSTLHRSTSFSSRAA